MYGTQTKITEASNTNLHGRRSSDKISHINIFNKTSIINLEMGKMLTISYDFDPLGSFLQKVVFKIKKLSWIEIGVSNDFDEFRKIVSPYSIHVCCFIN